MSAAEDRASGDASIASASRLRAITAELRNAKRRHRSAAQVWTRPQWKAAVCVLQLTRGDVSAAAQYLSKTDAQSKEVDTTTALRHWWATASTETRSTPDEVAATNTQAFRVASKFFAEEPR